MVRFLALGKSENRVLLMFYSSPFALIPYISVKKKKATNLSGLRNERLAYRRNKTMKQRGNLDVDFVKRTATTGKWFPNLQFSTGFL